MSPWHDDILQHAVKSGLLSQEQADELLAAGLDDNEFFEAIYAPERISDPDVRRLDEALRDYAKLWPKYTASASDVDPPPREVLDGLPQRYQVMRLLGSGGMGHVFEALDRRVPRRVALKVLPLRVSDPRMGEALMREGHVLGDLNHPGIVILHDIETLSAGRPCLVMELVDGMPVDQYADSHQLSVRQRSELLSKVARVVGAAHVAFKVHRDLKPNNILVTQDGSPKVIDFGIASVIGDLTESEEPLPAERRSLTLQGFGTLAYMSPEQIEGKPVDARSDVYSLGVVLYELLSGCLPVDRLGNSDSSMQPPCDLEPPPRVPLEERVEGLPADLCALVAKCLATDRKDRYPNADSLADDIDHFLSGHPVRAFQAGGRLYRGGKWLRRNRILATAAALTVAIAAVAFVVVLQQRNLAVLARHQAEESAIEAERQREGAENNAAEAQRQREQADAARSQVERERDSLESSLQRRALETATRLIQERRYFQAAIALEEVPRSRWGWECDRVAALANGSPRPTEIIGTHDWGIADLLATHDGRIVIASGHDGRVIAWDATTSEQTVLEDGSWSKSRLMWRHATHRLGSEPRDVLAPNCFTRLCWVEDDLTIAAASLHGKALLWHVQTGTRELLFTHDRPLYSVVAVDNGQVVVFGDDQGRLLIYDRSSGQQQSLQLEGGAILDICSLNDRLVCVAHEDGMIDLVDLEKRKSVARVNEPGPVWDLDFSRVAGLLAVGAALGAVHTYLLDDMERTLRKGRTYFLPPEENGAARNVHTVHVAADGSKIYAGDDLGRVVAWDRQSEQLRFVYPDQNASLFAMIGGKAVETLPLPLQRRVAAISSTADNETLFTGGHDSVLKRWTLEASPATTTLDVGPDASITFDVIDPTMLWVGGRDGGLSLWDTIDVRKLHHFPAHNDAIVQLATVPDSPLVATCAGSAIRFWHCRDKEIQPTYAPISHDKNLRSIALSPDGQRVAAYDVADQVSLWDVSSARLLAQCSMQGAGQGHAVAGVVAFNVDGTLLAAAGPGQTTWLLDGTTLEVIEKPPIPAGLGATALAWHPQKPRVLVVGDTMGRVAGYPRDLPWASMLDTIDSALDHQTVAGVDFTPDGRRLAAATRNGRVVIEDPEWIGRTYLVESPHAKVAPTTQLTFDPTGRRLALVHGDGHVEIWETGEARIPTAAPQTRAWTKEEFLLVPHGDTFHFRPSSVQLDSKGRLHLLFTKTVSGASISTQVVAIAHETDQGFREELLDDLGPLEDRGVKSLARSLALLIEEDQWIASVRRPLPKAGENSAELVLFHGGLSDRSSKDRPNSQPAIESITDAGNHGFDTFLAPAIPGKPAALHFSHDGHYLLRTSWQGAGWHTDKLGRQGDGIFLLATLGSDGRLHAVFSPTRFNGDPTPATYVAFDRSSGEELAREVLDRACCDTVACGIAIDPAGRPVMHYLRPNLDRSKTLIARHLTADGWKKSVIYSRLPSSVALSNLVCSPDGSVGFACFLPEIRRLELVGLVGDTWTRELVWQGPPARSVAAYGIPLLGPVLRLDHRDRPIIVLGFRSEPVGTVQVFRPAE